jgi:hypothetical protein
MEIAPWHSEKPGITVHHNNTLCTAGEMIQLHDLAPGTGEMPLCATCARLNKQDDEQ